MTERTCTITRKTNETDISVTLDLDGTGVAEINSGIGFLDHLLTTLSKHSRMDISLTCKGDLEIDDHHTAEDCAIALGEALDEALGERRGIARFGYAYAPLDEALARSVIDLSGRPHAEVTLRLRRNMLGELACENIGHFFESFAIAARMSLHVDVIKGRNDHHKAEAAFKAVARSLKDAVRLTESGQVPSTKGVL